MTKKTTKTKAPETDLRQSRKEVLLARKQAQQTRQIRIAMGVVAVLIGLVLLAALINELIVAPNRSVATVDGQEISLQEFQERVKFERARRIILLEEQLEAFGGDVGIIQQFASQLLVDLFPANAESFAESVLNQMADELLVEQAAAARGIGVTDADVDAEIGRSFNFFDGGLPTPFPTSTPTVQPTPSLTPVGTAVITETEATPTALPTATPGPTSTPFPTATAVSAESFQQQLNDLIAQYRALNTSEAMLRKTVQAQLLNERLADALAVERELAREAPHANFYLLVFSDPEEAEEVSESLTAENFLEVWNTIRSGSADPENASTAFATELFNRTEADLVANFNPALATAVFNTPLNTPTPIIQVVDQNGAINYFITVTSGIQTLPLTDSAYDALKQELVSSLLVELRAENVILRDFWRGRAFDRPALDPIFFAQPTPAPEQPLPEDLLPEESLPEPLPPAE
jgi:hypothetical protein